MTKKEKFKNIIHDISDIELSEIKDNSDFFNDLGFDSLDIIGLIVDVETKFKINIPDEKLEKVKTVEDAYNLLESLFLIRGFENMNIQDKIQKIHHQFGISEMANYKIEHFVETLIEKEKEQLRLYIVRQQEELLISFSNYLYKRDLLNIVKENIPTRVKLFLKKYNH